MGYCISQTNSSFCIKAEYIGEVLASLVAHGVENDDQDAKDLDEAFGQYRFRPTFDDKNNIVDITFEGEKSRDEDVFLQTIAPFVEPGSFIEFVGEDSAIWRWLFKYRTVKEIYPTIIWEE